MLESIFIEFFADLGSSFSNPQKRIFIGYLFCALAIGVAWLILKQDHSIKTACAKILSKHIWLSKSSLLDYRVFVLNKIISILFAPILLSHLAIATSLFLWLHNIFPSRPTLLAEHTVWIGSLLFTMTYFILDDFAKFYIHRLMHKLPILWAFHKVHHSAETLTPITVFRAHPIEIILFSFRSSVVQALCIASFIFFFGDNITLTSVLGANIFIFIFNLLGSNLRHSHIAIPYWKSIEKIFISPAQHQIHHSVEPRHHDKNFGVTLAIWDVLFSSHHHSEKNQQLTFGLTQNKKTNQSLKELYFNPCTEALTLIKTRFITIKQLIRSRYQSSSKKTTYPSCANNNTHTNTNT